MWHLNKSIWDVQSQGHIGSNKSQTMRFVMTVLSSDLVSHTQHEYILHSPLAIIYKYLHELCTANG